MNTSTVARNKGVVCTTKAATASWWLLCCNTKGNMQTLMPVVKNNKKKATELGFRFELCIFLKCSYSTAGLYLNTVAFTGSSFCTLLHPLASAVSHLTCQLALCFSQSNASAGTKEVALSGQRRGSSTGSKFRREAVI